MRDIGLLLGVIAVLLAMVGPLAGAEPERKVSDEEAWDAVRSIMDGHLVKDRKLYAKALEVFYWGLRGKRDSVTKIPDFPAVVAKVGTVKQVVFGGVEERDKFFHYRDNQPGALRVLLDLSQRTFELRADPLPKNPAADGYPGPVPADAPRVAEDVPIDLKGVGWISTGLYAPAGERVTLTVPPEMVAHDEKRRVKVRIGNGGDFLTLWGESQDHVNRFPEISATMEITKEITEFGNSFGGPIYIVLPDNGQDVDLGGSDTPDVTYAPLSPVWVKARIAGAVRMPYFKLGTTTLNEWRTKIRQYPGPLAELASDKIAFMLPSKLVQGIEDPERMLKTWDLVQDANNELTGRSLIRAAPTRIQFDPKVPGGWESGYPINAPLDGVGGIDIRIDDKTGQFVDGVWGMCHEIGHLHQKREWTFEHGVEVTVNLFPMYALEKLTGKPYRAWQQPGGLKKLLSMPPPGQRGWDWMNEGAFDCAWVKLQLYVELIDAFGWQPFKDVFRGYRSNHFDYASFKNRDDEHLACAGEFLTRFSRRVGKDLTPFFRFCGVIVLDKYADQLNDLPVWMPADFPASAPAK